jgi:hypothetical protein
MGLPSHATGVNELLFNIKMGFRTEASGGAAEQELASPIWSMIVLRALSASSPQGQAEPVTLPLIRCTASAKTSQMVVAIAATPGPELAIGSSNRGLDAHVSTKGDLTTFT